VVCIYVGNTGGLYWLIHKKDNSATSVCMKPASIGCALPQYCGYHWLLSRSVV